MKIAKIPTPLIITMAVCFGVIVQFMVSRDMRSPENNTRQKNDARQLCTLASTGIEYKKFEQLATENKIDHAPSGIKIEKNREATYSTYYFKFYSTNSPATYGCTIHVKNDLITEREDYFGEE
jgi:hypothetical protein